MGRHGGSTGKGTKKKKWAALAQAGREAKAEQIEASTAPSQPASAGMLPYNFFRCGYTYSMQSWHISENFEYFRNFALERFCFKAFVAEISVPRVILVFFPPVKMSVDSVILYLDLYGLVLTRYLQFLSMRVEKVRDRPQARVQALPLLTMTTKPLQKTNQSRKKSWPTGNAVTASSRG